MYAHPRHSPGALPVSGELASTTECVCYYQNPPHPVSSESTQPHTGPSSCVPREVLWWLEWEGAPVLEPAHHSCQGNLRWPSPAGWEDRMSSNHQQSLHWKRLASSSSACSVCCRACDHGNQMPSLVRENTQEYRSPTWETWVQWWPLTQAYIVEDRDSFIRYI